MARCREVGRPTGFLKTGVGALYPDGRRICEFAAVGCLLIEVRVAWAGLDLAAAEVVDVEEGRRDVREGFFCTDVASVEVVRGWESEEMDDFFRSCSTDVAFRSCV
jgi:hypothetical protein